MIPLLYLHRTTRLLQEIGQLVGAGCQLARAFGRPRAVNGELFRHGDGLAVRLLGFNRTTGSLKKIGGLVPTLCVGTSFTAMFRPGGKACRPI